MIMWQSVKHHLAAAGLLALTAWLCWPGGKEYLKGAFGTRAFGYGALVLFAVTLTIGPLARLFPRWFTRLLPYRRATGVWTAVSGSVHLLYVLQLVRRLKPNVLGLFLESQRVMVGPDRWKSYLQLPSPEQMAPHLTMVAWTGVIALAMLLVIALVSNDTAQRILGLESWKFVQRQAYTAFLLVALHVLIMRFGTKLKGTEALLPWAPWLLLAVAILQAAGFAATVWKRRLARPAHRKAS